MTLLPDSGIETSLLTSSHESHDHVMAVSVERYRTALDGFSIAPEQKDAFINSLWSVLVAFVDIGFKVHPVQQAQADPTDLVSLERDVIRVVKIHFGKAA